MPPVTKPKTVRAIHPNAGVEAWYRQKLQGAIRDMSNSVLVHIRAAFNRADPDHGFAAIATDSAVRYVEPFEGHAGYWLIAEDARNPSILLRRALKKWGGLWVGKLDAMSEELARRFADKNMRATQTSMMAAFKDSGFTIAFRPTASVRAAYHAVVAENVNLIKSIAPEYLKKVEQQVWASVMKGGDLSTLTMQVQNEYGVAYRRAALIARDQNAKAKAVIENTRRRELGIKEAIWQHSSGGKVPRPAHVAMNGQRFDLAKGMYDPDEKEQVWPGQLINCRCTSRAIIQGFNS